ncbi:agamous-like MADS-box protein AGL61 [Tasmannia lanceolata]|uniref:agamous-like MADS-box protein AGL61 n=1 Tax=Tasmannia lanceolata TaxID=3420 RepID=UPI004063358C
MSSSMVRKRSLGRQIIEIKRIENKDARQVCFSKRWSGLFKKVTELCILCGADFAIIVFSPGGKPSSYGHPCVNSIVDRYRYHDTPSITLGNKVTFSNGMQRMKLLSELNQQCSELLNQLEVAKKTRIELEEAAKARKMDGFLLGREIEGLEMNMLQQFQASMEELRAEVVKRADEIIKG